MRTAKLWSVLLAAVLLCACMAGLLFTGASASDAVTYTVGQDYADISAALDAAADYAKNEGWGSGASLVIEFTGTDNSAVLTEAGEGKSTNLLFGQPTIFREDGTRLPITIKGTASSIESNVIAWNHGATEENAKSYAAANDYTFENLLLPLAGVRSNYYAYLYAGSGSLTFTDVLFKSASASWGSGNKVNHASSYVTNLSADNFTMDAFYGWDAAKIAANKNSDGLIETSVTFGKNTRYFPASQTSNLAAVHYSPADWAINTSAGTTPAEKVAIAKELAKEFDYTAGQLASTCSVKPVDTAAKLVVDTKYAIRDGSDALYSSNIATGNGIGSIKGRVGTSPVAKVVIEVKSGIVGRISLDDHTLASTPRVGDNYLTVSGGSVGAGDNGVCIRLLKTPLYGDMINQISETTAEETNINWFQGSNESTFEGVYGAYSMTMTGGNIGASGYVGLFGGCGSVNKFTGGKIAGSFYGARYKLTGKNGLSSDLIPAECKAYIDTPVSVLNYISGDVEIGGTFYGSRPLSNADIGSVASFIDGGTFVGSFYGGCYTETATLDKVINVVKDGKFYVYCGSSTGTINTIINHFEGGTFGRNDNGISTYLGNYTGGSVSKGIENYYSGGTFTGYILSSNRSGTALVTNSRKDSNNDPLPAIYNRISGGTFAGVWGAGGGKIEGDVVTDITGGEFCAYNDNPSKYPYAFLAGLRNSGSHTTGDLITNISGGTFHTRVYGGTSWSTVPAEKNAGSTQLNITGGTFESQVLASSFEGLENDHYTSSSINIDLSENDVTLLGPVGYAALLRKGLDEEDNYTLNIIGGDNKLIFGANSDIIADSVEGTVNLYQSEGWYAYDYLRAPANSTVNVTQAPSVFGNYIKESDVLLIKGYGMQAQAATLLFDTKVGVKLLFDPADVALFGDALTFKVKLDGSTLCTVAAADLTDETIGGTAYKAYVLGGIGLKDFGTEISVEGAAFETQTFSIYSLAQTAQTAWSGEWLDLANAVVNLHKVYNLDETAVYSPESASYTASSVSRGAQADKVKSPVATLLMGDAVGIRVSFTLTQAPANFKATISTQEIPAELITVGTADAETGEVAVSMDLFFNPKYMEEDFDLVLSDDGGEYFTYTTSVATMASQLAADQENENADNAAALLYYIQQAVDCANL